jgi:hypothetical protein
MIMLKNMDYQPTKWTLQGKLINPENSEFVPEFLNILHKSPGALRIAQEEQASGHCKIESYRGSIDG